MGVSFVHRADVGLFPHAGRAAPATRQLNRTKIGTELQVHLCRVVTFDRPVFVSPIDHSGSSAVRCGSRPRRANRYCVQADYDATASPRVRPFANRSNQPTARFGRPRPRTPTCIGRGLTSTSTAQPENGHGDVRKTPGPLLRVAARRPLNYRLTSRRAFRPLRRPDWRRAPAASARPHPCAAA